MKLNVDILYLTNEGISTLNIHFAVDSKSTPLRLLLASDGSLDVVYSKTYINLAGIAQSIILDVQEFMRFSRL